MTNKAESDKCHCDTDTICDWCQEHRCSNCGDLLNDDDGCPRCDHNHRNGQYLSQFV
jgi:hypothetical protein